MWVGMLEFLDNLVVAMSIKDVHSVIAVVSFYKTKIVSCYPPNQKRKP